MDEELWELQKAREAQEVPPSTKCHRRACEGKVIVEHEGETLEIPWTSCWSASAVAVTDGLGLETVEVELQRGLRR